MSEQYPKREARSGPVNRKNYYNAAVLVVALILLFWAGTWYGRSGAAGSAGQGDKRILYYVDPMNPSHTSPEPGLAPCGMKMEPVYADAAAASPDGLNLLPGSVKITPAKQQLVGVKLSKVEETPWTHTLRALGRVAVDENRIYQLNAFTDGWIVRAYLNSTGSIVRRDEPLASFYSKDLPTALQSFFYASHASESLAEGIKLPQIQIDALDAQKKLAEGTLMNLGMNRLQIDELARTRQVTQEIILYAPVTSFILSRKITPGQKFAAGQELYQLADLSRVWVLADLYGDEVNYVKSGEKVRVTLPNQKEKFMATVSEILPEFNPSTLTLRVRLEVDNPNFILRPGMFTDVDFPITLPPSLNVPVDAVMDSGLKQVVFVDRGQGFFEPRQVQLGWRLGDRVEIIAGLKPGESIVTSGNFLIDSESRMRLAAAGMLGEATQDPASGLSVDAGKAAVPGGPTAVPQPVAATEPLDPVCGQQVNPSRAKAQGLISDYDGNTYYFARYACKHDFDKNPQHFLSSIGPAAGQVLDPVCGLPVTADIAKKSGLTSDYQGKTYYFDTEGCKQRFDNSPRRYLTGYDTAFSGTYKHVPTDPNLLLRLRRDFLGALPTWKTQDLPGPVQVQPQGNLLPPPAPPRAAPPAPSQVAPQMAPPTIPPPTPSPGAQTSGEPGQDQASPSDHEQHSTAAPPQGPQTRQAPPPPQSPDACHDEEHKH